MNPDVWLFHVINSLVGTIPLLDTVARVLVNDFAVPTAMALAAIWLWFAGSNVEERLLNQRAVIFIVLAVLFSNALIKDLSYVYFRPRPFATEAVKLLFYRPSVSSFPSVPVAVAFCFAAGAWRADRRLGLGLGMLGATYGLARIYAGVHYPLDVLGGAVIGAGAVYVVWKLDFVFRPLSDKVIGFARRLYFT